MQNPLACSKQDQNICLHALPQIRVRYKLLCQLTPHRKRHFFILRAFLFQKRLRSPGRQRRLQIKRHAAAHTVRTRACPVRPKGKA